MPFLTPQSALPVALDRLLATQPEGRARLARHAGKVVRLVLPLSRWRLRITADGGCAAVTDEVDADTEIHLPAEVLPALAVGEPGAFGRARVLGDGALANDLSVVLTEFDWTLALRPLAGDVLAARGAQALAAFGRWRRQAGDAGGRAVAEYLAYEAGVLAEPAAVRRFVAEVDELRDAAARLDARIALLERSPR